MKDRIPISTNEAKKAVQDARDNIVDLVNASRNEIVLPVVQPKAITLQF